MAPGFPFWVSRVAGNTWRAGGGNTWQGATRWRPIEGRSIDRSPAAAASFRPVVAKVVARWGDAERLCRGVLGIHHKSRGEFW